MNTVGMPDLRKWPAEPLHKHLAALVIGDPVYDLRIHDDILNFKNPKLEWERMQL